MPSPSPPEASPELRTYRVVCLLTAVLVPAFGYSFHWRDPSVVDPLWLRWVMGVLPLMIVAGTYASRWVRTHLTGIGTALIYTYISWFGALTALNHLAPEYAVGYLLVVVMIGVATPDTVPLPITVGYLLYAVVIAAGAAFSVRGPGIDPWLFYFCVAATAIAIFLGLWLRLEMRSRLQASEVRYRTVFDRTTDGLFLTDAETHHFLHANEAYLTLTGYTLDELRTLTLHDVVVAPPGFIEERARELLACHHVAIGEQQHRCKDGTLLDLNIGVSTVEQEGRAVFCTTAHDLTEHKRVQAEIQKASARAEEMLRMKSTLLDTMSHELRTPLAGILGFTEVLAEEVTEDQRELVRALHQNAHRLSDTLSALLDLAQLRSGETKINIEVVDVAEAANEVADLFRHRIEAKGLGFCVETAPAARSQLDREALRRLLSHLLSNATKFTERGEVTLLVEADSRRVFIHVIDTGIGMHEDDVPTLFNAFEQASTGIYRIHEGTGLGLSVTRQLIDLMGGHVEVRSMLGVGTTFTVSFARTWASPEPVLEHPRPASHAIRPPEQPGQAE